MDNGGLALWSVILQKRGGTSMSFLGIPQLVKVTFFWTTAPRILKLACQLAMMAWELQFTSVTLPDSFWTPEWASNESLVIRM